MNPNLAITRFDVTANSVDALVMYALTREKSARMVAIRDRTSRFPSGPRENRKRPMNNNTTPGMKMIQCISAWYTTCSPRHEVVVYVSHFSSLLPHKHAVQ
jgi:hypothetical protein